jgi:hypothetical protein
MTAQNGLEGNATDFIDHRHDFRDGFHRIVCLNIAPTGIGPDYARYQESRLLGGAQSVVSVIDPQSSFGRDRNRGRGCRWWIRFLAIVITSNALKPSQGRGNQLRSLALIRNDNVKMDPVF